MPERKTISSRDFFNRFEKKGLNNFRSLGYYKKDRKIKFSTWRTIIMTYFQIYFYELFFLKKPYYFFLGGLMRICLIPPKKKTNKGKNIFFSKPNVGIFWYNIPCRRLLESVKVKQLKGSTNRFPKLSNLWKQSNDPYLLPSSFDLKQYHRKMKTYYRI